jgi:hypothetical protein
MPMTSIAAFALLVPILEIVLIVFGIIALVYIIKALKVYIRKNS